MDTMYKLTKQIDALTYNARAVLNALVRSCIAAGSSNGFKVTRYGNELKLDRADIYRLYDFYQTWANGSAGYEPYTHDPEEFAAIVDICDGRWKEPGLVTGSLVTHSKMLYLVSTNKNNESSDYWLGLIRDSSSPKLVVNSAPIPLNLRTPLYDADLSTKSFSQYETYLFPSGYNKISIIGMPGDGEDHIGGGRSWTWDIDTSLNVTAPRVRFGRYTDTERRVENYGNTEYSFSFGIDTYALGERSASIGGMNNIAYGENSATVGGNELLAIGVNSVIAGGNRNVTVRENTFAFGRSSHAIGPQSMAGNELACAGSFAYRFTIEEPEDSGTVDECETISDSTTGMCVDVGDSITSGEGRSTIRISNQQVVSNGMWKLYINAGDIVTIYAQTRKDGTTTVAPYETEGYAFKPLKFTVVNVSRSGEDFLVHLNGGIPRGETFKSLWVNGGYVATTQANYRDMDLSGTLLHPVEWLCGYASNALNYNTFAPGVHQTVVGQMNYGDRDAKFVVGTGSSYIGYDSFRRNGLAIAQGYGYMQTASRSAIIGVSDYGQTAYRDFNGMYLRHGAWMFHNGDSEYEGHVIAYDEATEIGLSKMRTEAEDNKLIFVRSGSSYLSATHDVTVCLESRAGTMVINSGSYVGVQHSYDALLNDGILRGDEGGAIAIYSENGMELRNTNRSKMMSFHNSGYIVATFAGLALHGNTWGTLATTDNALSHWVYHSDESTYHNATNTPGHDVDYPNVIAQSGFFYGDNGFSTTPVDEKLVLPTKANTFDKWETNQGNGFHIINSAVRHKNLLNQDGYDVSCLVMPGSVRWSDVAAGDKPHIKFINSFIYGTGNNGVMPTETYITEEIAYLSDLDKASKAKMLVCNTGTVLYRTVRALDNPFRIDYPKDFEDTHGGETNPFTRGSVEFATGNIARMNYFNCYAPVVVGTVTREYQPLRWICGDTIIAAPLDNPGQITLIRQGNIIMMTLNVTLKGNSAVEVMAHVPANGGTLTPGILGALGVTPATTVILSGGGVYGTHVTCTISNNLATTDVNTGIQTIPSLPTSCLLDFIMVNPEGQPVSETITLTGTITKNVSI